MKTYSQRRSYSLVAVGLLGVVLYQFIVRLAHPAFMENDFFHGIWLGIFLGIEILGAFRLRREQCKQSD